MASPFFDGMADCIFSIHGEATQAEYLPVVGSPSFIDVVFIDNYQSVSEFGTPYGSQDPTAWIKKADIDPECGDSIDINGTVYIVQQIEPDTHEITKLILSN